MRNGAVAEFARFRPAFLLGQFLKLAIVESVRIVLRMIKSLGAKNFLPWRIGASRSAKQPRVGAISKILSAALDGIAPSPDE